MRRDARNADGLPSDALNKGVQRGTSHKILGTSRAPGTRYAESAHFAGIPKLNYASSSACGSRYYPHNGGALP